jgi:hypothetical protein
VRKTTERNHQRVLGLVKRSRSWPGAQMGQKEKAAHLGIKIFFQTLQGIKDIERKIENKYIYRDSAKSEIRKESEGGKGFQKHFQNLILIPNNFRSCKDYNFTSKFKIRKEREGLI